jgi:hypothetical protein
MLKGILPPGADVDLYTIKTKELNVFSSAIQHGD